jgi:phosphoribosyl 1,2-cyclic phosphate phosphodiesterase
MTKRNTLTILGSGTSVGIPMVGCECSVCSSTNTKDKRLRTSILLNTKNDKSILIDTTPDLRYQLLRENVKNIDAAIITHDHADHVHGIDDLRPLCFNPPKTIPIIAETNCSEILKTSFPYIFKASEMFSKERPVLGGGIPDLQLKVLDIKPGELKALDVEGEEITFFLLPHGYTSSLGIIHEDFAYIADCFKVPDNIVDELSKRSLSYLLINCLQEKSHETHLTVEKSFRYIDQIKPKEAGLVHMNHELSHDYLEKKAEEHFQFQVAPVYDGQIIEY